MPTLAPSNKAFAKRTAAGFTLIEMLVVLTILGLIAAVAAPRIGQRPGALVRQEAGARLDAAVQAARREAARSGSVLAVDPAAFVPGAVLATALPTPPGRALIRIHPDGSSNGGTVSVDGRPVATVDWLTSEVRDAS
jgi:general secretion pathway protein H